MLIPTSCPPKIYQDYMSKTFERKVVPFFETIRERFNNGVPEGQLCSITGSPTRSKSYADVLQWLDHQSLMSDDDIATIRKRAFKVTYQGQLLTSSTVVFL